MIRHLLAALILSSLLAAPSRAADSEIQGYIMGISGDRVSIDLGAFHGLKAGDVGILRRRGRRMGALEVVSVDRTNAFLRVLDASRSFVPAEGDTVFFTVAEGQAQLKRKAGAGQGGEDSFVPLLAPVAMPKKKAAAKVSTSTHGRLRLWQFLQQVSPVDIRQKITRLDSDGSVDRIIGTPWSFVWAGNASYRDGNRQSSSDDFRQVRPHAHRLMLTRPLTDKGFIRAGRFFPNELPGLGTVDGLAVQVPVMGVKVGAVAGNRPDRHYQEFSSHENLGALYASVETGVPGRKSYGATLGVMHTRWMGRADELAALLDQRFDLGPMLNAYQTAQFDLDAGTAAVHKGIRLTRFDFSLNSNLRSWLSLRSGVSHFEPIDVAAERSMAGVDPALYIDNGYWRYWAGSGQTLPWGVGLDEEISWTRAADKFQPGLGRLTVSRQGLPGLANGRAYVTGYNLPSTLGTDYGSSTGMSAPFLDGKLNLDLSAGFRYDRGDRGESAPRRWKAGDASVRLDWRPNRTWQMDAALTRVWQNAIHSSSVSGGVSYRW